MVLHNRNQAPRTLGYHNISKLCMIDTIKKINTSNGYDFDTRMLSTFFDPSFFTRVSERFPSKTEFETCIVPVMHAMFKHRGTHGIRKPSTFAYSTWNSHLERIRKTHENDTTVTPSDNSRLTPNGRANNDDHTRRSQSKNSVHINPWEQRMMSHFTGTTSCSSEREGKHDDQNRDESTCLDKDPFPPLPSSLPDRKEQLSLPQPEPLPVQQAPLPELGALPTPEPLPVKQAPLLELEPLPAPEPLPVQQTPIAEPEPEPDYGKVVAMLRDAFRTCGLDTRKKLAFSQELCARSVTPLERVIMGIAYGEAQRCVTCLIDQGHSDPIVEYYVKKGKTRDVLLKLVHDMLIEVSCALQELAHASAHMMDQHLLREVDDMTLWLTNIVNGSERGMRALGSFIHLASAASA